MTVTIDVYDHDVGWEKARPIYKEVFGEKGKPEWVIENMFAKRLARLFVLSVDGIPAGFALGGQLGNTDLFLIDYLGIARPFRKQGLGKRLVDDILVNAQSSGFIGTIIEVEAEEEGAQYFWKRIGFHATEYIHHYIWVPEPYITLYMEFENGSLQNKKPQYFFQLIEKFHGDSYKKQAN